ncbi:hypothetical protein OPQ81_005530 [Rhizoctonia solani]|nr:hypothetical protein OPQ81_005530 [Rhizoctonia solani]
MPQLIQLVERWDTKWPVHLSALLHDAWRFTSTFALGAASDSTPHIYTSMLPFWPEFSPIATRYTGLMQGLIETEGTAISQRQHALLATWYFDDRIISPSFSPDGTLVAVGVWSRVYLLNSSTGRMVLPPLEGDNEFKPVSSVQFSPDGTRIASVSSDGTIRVWSTQSGKTVLGPLGGQTNFHISQVAFSPDGAHIFSLTLGGNMCIWNASSGEYILAPREFDQGNLIIPSIKCTIDGHCVVFDSNGRIIIHDVRGKQTLRVLVSYDSPCHFTSFDISPDGTRIATGCGDSSICIWDFETGELVLGPLGISGPRPHTPILSVSFSPNSLYLVSCSSDGIWIWDTRNGTLVIGPLGRHARSTSASFSPDGAYIISVSDDQMLRLWDAHETHRIAEPLLGHTKSVSLVGFSLDGTRVVSASEDLNTYVWDAESGEMVFGPIEKYCSMVAGALYSKGFSHIISRIEQKLALVDTQTGNITP